MAITGGVDNSDPSKVRFLSSESASFVPAPIERIFWAIDLDSSHTQSTINDLKRAAKVVSHIFPHAKIYPAHVINPEGMAWDGESPRDRSERLHPVIQSAMNWLVEEATQGELENVAKPFVIDASSAPVQGVGALAKKLSAWATKFHADAILTFSSRRSGFADYLVSSFNDHLISESKLPIFVVNPHTEVRTGPVSDLIFATNFSETCRKTFDEALVWAKHFKASIRLFNKPEANFAPAVYGTSTLFGSGWSGLPPDGLDTDVVNTESAIWLERANSEGVQVSFIRDTSGLGAAEAISTYCAQFQHPILIMSTCHGPLESGLWGSVTRDVLHQSIAPVLILRA